MKVVVTGPESSGTSMVSRMFRQAGAEVFHRSATWGQRYASLRLLVQMDADAVIVVFRDPIATMKSQEWAAQPYEKLQTAYAQLLAALVGCPVPMWVIPYESLVLNPAAIDPLLKRLGLDASKITEQVRDENAKYYNR